MKLRITNYELRNARMFFIVHCSLFILAGCGGVRVQRPFVSLPFVDERENALQFPLEKIFETTTVAAVPKDAGVFADSLLVIGTFNGEVRFYNVLTGKSFGYFDAGSSVGNAPLVDSNRIFIPLLKDKYSFVAYDVQQKSIDWKVAIGDVETKPLLLGKYILVVNNEGTLFSFNKRNGIMFWKYISSTAKKGVRAHSSPVTDGVNIYFGNDEGTLFCINGSNGELVWKNHFNGNIFSTPALDNDNIYITTNIGECYAMKKNSGTLQWKYNVSSSLYSSATVNAKQIFLATTSGNVISLDKESGKEIWKQKFDDVININPHLRKNILYIGTLGKTLYALDVTTGDILWSEQLSGRIKSNLLSWDNYLVAFIEDRTILVFKGKEGGN
ncbi:MAG: PQQ-binding-like beta-propeller repeat protein [Ignavibacteriales bacterium]|nr:PQQ-binding-like beta-propeller repeat protein [Ignavibacteriales bacterium]